jgi:uncharacterized damage-inducible protein DinB
MKHFLLIALTAAGALQAQGPLSTETKAGYNAIKKNLLAMAEKMTDENYNFKPTPDIRTFGQLVGHVADSQMRTCSAINGESKQAGAASMTSKADLEKALKASFDECDKAYDSLTDETATKMVKMGQRESTKLGALVRNVVHDNEEYGYMSVYLRLKGVVPPSSAK